MWTFTYVIYLYNIPILFLELLFILSARLNYGACTGSIVMETDLEIQESLHILDT